MKVNKNVIIIKEDTKVGGMLLEAGDAFVRINGVWSILEAEGDAEDEEEDEKEMKEEEDEDSKEDDKESKKEESKKRK